MNQDRHSFEDDLKQILLNKLILVSQFFYSVWLSRSDLVDSGKNKSNSFNEILTDQDLYSILKKGVPLILLHAYIRLKTNFM